MRPGPDPWSVWRCVLATSVASGNLPGFLRRGWRQHGRLLAARRRRRRVQSSSRRRSRRSTPTTSAQQVEAIYASERYWPEPLIQINPSYQPRPHDRRARRGGRARARSAPRSSAADQASRRRAAAALQAPGAGDRARRAGRELRRHHRHGLGQVALLLHPDRQRGARREAEGRRRARTRAIVIYPMNALANSQLEELEQVPRQRPGRAPGHLRALHRPGGRRRSASGSPRTRPTSCSPTS